MRVRGKKKWMLTVSVLLTCVLLAGCTKTGAQDAGVETGTIEDAYGEKGEADRNGEDNKAVESDRAAEESISYEYQEISLTLPGGWKDRYIIEEDPEGNGFSVYQKASYEEEEGWGFLFSVWIEDEPVYDMPGGRAVAYTADHMY